MRPIRSHMKSGAGTLSAAVFLLVAGLLLLPAAADAAGPKADFSLLEWNFGEIYQWTNPSVKISITNSGDEDLKVLDVKKSCGCTAAILSNSVIKPGEKGFLDVSFLSGDMQGSIRKMVKVTTNDPASPDTVIRVTGFVKEDKASIAALEPEYVDIGVVAPYETRYIELMLKNLGNKDLPVGGVSLPDGYFMDSAHPDKVPARGAVALRIGYRPPEDKGPVNDVLTVKALDLEGREVGLRVVGYVCETTSAADSIVVTPTRFRVAPDGRERVLELSVVNGGTSDVIIEDADSSIGTKAPELVRPELAPGEAGKVRLPLNTDGLKPGTKGYLYLRLAVPIEVEAPGDK